MLQQCRAQANDKIIFIQNDSITPENMTKVQALNELAKERGQSLAQLSLSWVLRDEGVTSALIGASRQSKLWRMWRRRRM